MEDRVDVRLDDTAQINCMFSTEDGLGGTIIQWFYVTRTGEKQRIYYLESGLSYPEKGTPFSDRISVNGTGATEGVVLTINKVQLKDELEFICYVKSLTDGTAEGRTKLRVFRVQKGISIQEESMSKIGTCEVTNGYPKPNITWYKDNTPIVLFSTEVNVLPSITIESTGLYSVKSELAMKVVKEDADALFYCEVTYFAPGEETMMVETSPINITVYYPHTDIIMWVESPKGKIKEGDNVVIQCSGNGNNPYTTFSIKGGENLSADTSELVVENITRLDSGKYECFALDMESFEEISTNITVFVNYLEDVVIKPGKIMEVPQGDEREATCNALSSLPTQTAWFKEVVKGHTLALKDATFDTAGTYVCIVTAEEVEGLERSGTMRVYIEGVVPLDLNCYVQGYPYPTVTWSTSEGKVSHFLGETTDDGVISTASVKVTGDIIVFCNATNSLGEDSVTFNIKAKGSGVIIAVIIICILLLAILGSVLYFLYKKGKICGRSGKQDLSKGKAGKDNIVVEMKSDNTEEAVLLGVNGEKQLPSDQVWQTHVRALFRCHVY
uniref:Ig-like domain-containing protein n=1 Tax=Periophthalmus magnuspinnatus TaxID=409849 RepID=A0A3B4BD17_9GOBI